MIYLPLPYYIIIVRYRVSESIILIESYTRIYLFDFKLNFQPTLNRRSNVTYVSQNNNNNNNIFY